MSIYRCTVCDEWRDNDWDLMDEDGACEECAPEEEVEWAPGPAGAGGVWGWYKKELKEGDTKA